MCGRFTLTQTETEAIQESFGLASAPTDLAPRFNIAPTQAVAVVIDEGQGKQLDAFRWGLIPSWAKDHKIGNKMINARGETAASKPSFRSAFKRRRCLILADGFYEWQKSDQGKIPTYIYLQDHPLFAFAGLWETWHAPGGEVIPSCTIITTEANQVIAPIHNRMPVILPKDAYETWLNPQEQNQGRLQACLKAYPDERIRHHAVSRMVNSPANDQADCILPVS